jgi:predicted Fe-Mo cluster-binding NifX family protein
MKIAITCDKENLDSLIDQRFGRCKYFLIIDVENNKIINTQAISNTCIQEAHGAGIKAAEQLGNLNVDTLITGTVGPNAETILNKLKIKVYSKSGVAKDALNEILNISFNNKVEVPKVEDSKVEVPKVEDSKVEDSKVEDPKVEDLKVEFTKVEDFKENKINNKEEKIFLPLLNNEGLLSKISLHFGHAPFFGIYNVNKKDLKIVPNNLDHTNANKSPIAQICDAFNITTIFARDIGDKAIKEAKENNISLKTGNYDTINKVIDNLHNIVNLKESCGH